MSMKDIYQHPTVSSLATALVAPRPCRSGGLADGPRGGAGRISTSTGAGRRHFFDDLGADSRYGPLLRPGAETDDLPSVSMKDIYRHPTSQPATALSDTCRPAVSDSPVPAEWAPSPARAAGLRMACAGSCSCLVFLGYSYLARAHRGYEWISAAQGRATSTCGRSSRRRAFVVLFTFRSLAKWVLIGRWKPQQIRIWSLGYFRFWIVKTLVRSNPLVLLFVGSPLYSLYLRALGAKIGRGRRDLLPARAGVHRPAHHRRRHGDPQGRRSSAATGPTTGWIQTGRVTLGRNVFVGEKTVLDINTSMGDGSQLGHASSLHSGQGCPPASAGTGPRRSAPT